jgi:hypothetical protein
MFDCSAMKPLILLLALALVGSTLAEDAKPILVPAGKIVAHPDLQQPLGADWKSPYGTWEVKAGELVIAEHPEDKHAAVLWHQVALQSAIIECEIKFDGGSGFLIGCDSPVRHVGRLVVTAKNAKLAEDSSEIKGKQPGMTLAETVLDLKPGQWYPVRMEWTGDRMAARVAGKSIQGQHPTLSATKARWWFAVSGATVRVRQVKVTEGK